MTEEHRITRVTEDPPVPASSSTVSETVRRQPSAAEIVRRIVVFLFGVAQALIVLRIVLLLLDASRGNALVSWIYDTSAQLVNPFVGILHTNAVQTGVSVLDVAAVVALVGWTILELLILAAVGVARREP